MNIKTRKDRPFRLNRPSQKVKEISNIPLKKSFLNNFLTIPNLPIIYIGLMMADDPNLYMSACLHAHWDNGNMLM